MSRIAQRFEQLKAQGRTALVPFVTAGDPGPATTVPLMGALMANAPRALISSDSWAMLARSR